MPDQIFSAGPLPAPLKYNVPGSQRMIPRACQAVFNGSGASGDYVPALIFRSQAGHVIARAILEQTVTAGDDAEVSWFPGVKVAPASTPSTPLGLAYARIVGDIAAPGGDCTISDFDTNYAAGYVQVSATQWQIPQQAGFALCYFVNESGFVALNGTLNVRLTAGTGFIVVQDGANAVKISQLYLASGLIEAFEWGNNWRAQVFGTDTHAWAFHAYFFTLAFL